MMKPCSVLPHSTQKGPMPRENGGSGAIPWVSTDDKRVRVGRELLHPDICPKNSSTEHDGSSRLLSQVDSL